MKDPEATRPEITFSYDERSISAHAGDSLLTVLVSVGEMSLSADGARGFFCNMGVCQECRVVVDGHRGTRACLTTVSSGMHVTFEDA